MQVCLVTDFPYFYLLDFVSLQLYMETIQDLLNPVNDNIPIMEDPRTGEVSLPGATVVEIRDQHTFLELLRLGEAHRFAANTKLNTESSRSHAILMVNNSFVLTSFLCCNLFYLKMKIPVLVFRIFALIHYFYCSIDLSNV